MWLRLATHQKAIICCFYTWDYFNDYTKINLSYGDLIDLRTGSATRDPRNSNCQFTNRTVLSPLAPDVRFLSEPTRWRFSQQIFQNCKTDRFQKNENNFVRPKTTKNATKIAFFKMGPKWRQAWKKVFRALWLLWGWQLVELAFHRQSGDEKMK